jgi:hypothetical protein
VVGFKRRLPKNVPLLKTENDIEVQVQEESNGMQAVD